jgi:peptide/nickel transport system permease protein
MKGAKLRRVIATSTLGAIVLIALAASWISPYSYEHQFRNVPNAAPSAAHLLGTDTLGRDLFSRLLYGTRVSLLLAPAAALLATLMAGLLGAGAALLRGVCERAILSAADLLLALPLIFVLIALRAMLPLDVAPAVSVLATFLLLGLLGWPSALRVVWAATQRIRECDFYLLARASGCSPRRLILRHLFPNLRPVLLAQFWILIPAFILAEATLSMLGLGVMEPVPSWGSLLRGLENFTMVSANPWRLAPLILLIIVVVCFQLVLPNIEEPS